MALQQPPQTQQQQQTALFAHWVRHFVHFDNLAKLYSQQASGARLKRDEFEELIINYLRSNHMEKAIIQVSGATLQMSEEKSAPSLSITRIETYLHGYFKQKGNGLDETESILRYIRLQKTNDTQITACLKKTPLPVIPPPPPPLSGTSPQRPT